MEFADHFRFLLRYDTHGDLEVSLAVARGQRIEPGRLENHVDHHHRPGRRPLEKHYKTARGTSRH